MENGKELLVKDDSLPFKLMDALDDQLIVAELEGRIPEILTYHFSDKGQEIWGLSKAGVDEATAELAKQGEVIREIELNFIDNENEGYFSAKAGRFVISKDGKEILLDTKFGVKRQPKKTSKGNDNSFWYEQGSVKACRNASMRLIPKTIIQAVIENAKLQKKVKEIGQKNIDKKIEEKSEEDFKTIHKESEKKFSEYHDRMMAIKNKFELKAWWEKHNVAIEKDLLPEHFKVIIELKDSLKEKLT